MIVEIKDLTKKYKEITALDGFDLEIKEGERLALLGPNGCGKTTAINCMTGLLTFNSGSVKLFGEEMGPDKRHIKARIGLVPQEVVVSENLTARENIDYFCSLYVKDRAKRKAMVDEAIRFTELKDYVKFFPKKLSGGLKRRLNIACGIAHRPDFLILDEPTVAVDAQTRSFILSEIKTLCEEGMTILYTTHYLDEVEQVAEKIVIMEKGKAIASGTADELKNSISTKEIVSVRLLADEDRTSAFETLPNLLSAVCENGTYKLSFHKGENNLRHLLDFLSEKAWEYDEIYSERPSLEDVFLSLTGRDLRE